MDARQMGSHFLNISPSLLTLRLIYHLGYESWQNFEKVIKKAMTAAALPDSNLTIEDHFKRKCVLILDCDTIRGQIRKYEFVTMTQAIKACIP